MNGTYDYGLWGLVSYARLVRKEEQELEARFGEAYRAYRDRVPAFLPTPKYRMQT